MKNKPAAQAADADPLPMKLHGAMDPPIGKIYPFK